MDKGKTAVPILKSSRTITQEQPGTVQPRDVKLDELDQWIARYKAVAQLSLEESPQMLEQLGWVAPS